MSESAETLKSALWELMQATGRRAKEARFTEAATALDALLAEHRAEVETLTAERDAYRQTAIEADMARVGAEEALSAARDAALEEAARRMEQWSGLRDEHGDAAERTAVRIRALTSQPARRYVDAEKVWEAVAESRALEALGTPLLYLDGWNAALDDVARRLGVDLDAEEDISERAGEGERIRPRSGHIVRRNRRAAGDARQTCTCTGTCRGAEGLGANWTCTLGRERP